MSTSTIECCYQIPLTAKQVPLVESFISLFTLPSVLFPAILASNEEYEVEKEKLANHKVELAFVEMMRNLDDVSLINDIKDYFDEISPDGLLNDSIDDIANCSTYFQIHFNFNLKLSYDGLIVSSDEGFDTDFAFLMTHTILKLVDSNEMVVAGVSYGSSRTYVDSCGGNYFVVSKSSIRSMDISSFISAEYNAIIEDCTYVLFKQNDMVKLMELPNSKFSTDITIDELLTYIPDVSEDIKINATEENFKILEPFEYFTMKNAFSI